MPVEQQLTLEEILTEIEKNWEFNETKYPELIGKTDEEKALFAIRHILLHFIKDMQPIAADIERWEHNSMSWDNLHVLEAARKMTLDSLRLLKLLKEQGENLQWWLLHENKR